MDLRKQFLSKILETPGDDAPRLIFADWLEEHGEAERAEFIRLQCTLAAGGLSAEEQSRLQQREAELLNRHGWDWAEQIGTRIAEWAYQRGFVEKVQTCLEVDAEAIQQLLQLAPITHIRDTTQLCDLDGVLESLPLLGGLTGLEFWTLYAFEDEKVREMLLSPHLQNLRTLILHHDRNGNLVDEQVIVNGLMSPHRANLEELAVNVDCSWRGPSNRILRAIAESPYLRKLKKLNISNAGDPGNNPQLTVETVRLLADSPNLQNLEELDLRSTHATAAVWQAILEIPWLPRLKKLYLGGACEVPEGEWIPVVGNLAQIARWREAWDALVDNIDWETDFIDPWSGGCWQGQSWEGRQQSVLFGIADFVHRKDWDGLEKHYRKLCVEYKDEATAQAIAALNFAPWTNGLRPHFEQALENAAQSDSTTVFLRVRPDLNWSGEFGVHAEFGNDPFASLPDDLSQPFAAYSYSSPETTIETVNFEQASVIYTKHSSRSSKPDGAANYLIARSMAAFGKLVEEIKPAPQVFLSFMSIVLRMTAGR